MKIRSLVLSLAVAGGFSLLGARASADTLVDFKFTIATSFDASGNILVTSAGDVFADIYSTPAITTNNFLTYVNSGAYANSFIHRSIPGFILQGGGYDFVDPTHIGLVTANPPIPLEYNLPNIRGTLAMARTTDPNSANSQFFINLADNSAALGPGGSSPEGYAVFGNVLSGSMSNVDYLASIPTYDYSTRIGSPFTDLPLTQQVLSYPYFLNLNSVTTIGKLGDINLDGQVNVDDLLAFDKSYLTGATGWGPNDLTTGYASGDLNMDGVVDAADWAILSAAYSQDNGGLSAGLLADLPMDVPEPGTMLMLSAAGLLMLRRRHRRT